jgi:hypothetical protein
MRVAQTLRMKVHLLKKLAERVDGIDLRAHHEGESFELPPTDASLLLAERWAVPERRERSEGTAPRRRTSDYSEQGSRLS